LKASSTVGPALETGLGAASAERRVVRKAVGLVRARVVQPSRSRLGSMGTEGKPRLDG
jgi:hypothetical protein